jgi:hypothetical protein
LFTRVNYSGLLTGSFATAVIRLLGLTGRNQLEAAMPDVGSAAISPIGLQKSNDYDQLRSHHCLRLQSAKLTLVRFKLKP